MYSSTAMMVTIGYSRARKNTFDRRMDLFNEIKLMIIAYHIMLFTAFVPDSKTKWLVGYSCCLALVIGILVNSSKVIVAPIKALRYRVKLWLAKRQMRQAVKHRRDK